MIGIKTHVIHGKKIVKSANMNIDLWTMEKLMLEIFRFVVVSFYGFDGQDQRHVHIVGQLNHMLRQKSQLYLAFILHCFQIILKIFFE